MDRSVWDRGSESTASVEASEPSSNPAQVRQFVVEIAPERLHVATATLAAGCRMESGGEVVPIGDFGQPDGTTFHCRRRMHCRRSAVPPPSGCKKKASRYSGVANAGDFASSRPQTRRRTISASCSLVKARPAPVTVGQLCAAPQRAKTQIRAQSARPCSRLAALHCDAALCRRRS